MYRAKSLMGHCKSYGQKSRWHKHNEVSISLPVDFLLLLPTTPSHLSLSLSLLPWSLAVMLLWLHSKGYAVYPPSLPVTPAPATHTHTHNASSVPGPVSDILSIEPPTYQLCAFAKRLLPWIELETQTGYRLTTWVIDYMEYLGISVLKFSYTLYREATKIKRFKYFCVCPSAVYWPWQVKLKCCSHDRNQQTPQRPYLVHTFLLVGKK